MLISSAILANHSVLEACAPTADCCRCIVYDASGALEMRAYVSRSLLLAMGSVTRTILDRHLALYTRLV